MALRQEDGTGVARANTAVTVDEMDEWAEERGLPAFRALADDAAKEAALVKAADYLKNEQRFCYRGSRRTLNQGLPFPRTGCTTRRGPTVPEDVVPQMFKDAQMALAELAAAGTNLQPVLERGGKVKTETIDVITTTYADDAPGEALFTEAMGYLAPLLRLGPDYTMSPFFVQPDPPAEFASGTYDNPPSGTE